jgi:hypothetical protein
VEAGKKAPKSGLADWRKSYNEGAKIRARIIFVDPHDKKVSLVVKHFDVQLPTAGSTALGLPALTAQAQSTHIHRAPPQRVELITACAYSVAQAAVSPPHHIPHGVPQLN